MAMRMAWWISLGAWILRLVRAGVPLSGEPLFRWLVSHCDAAG